VVGSGLFSDGSISGKLDGNTVSGWHEKQGGWRGSTRRSSG
jgi:hypothetical protein